MTTFRFYAELRDLLPAAARGHEVVSPVLPRQSVKDAIEAWGVPHTEVDLVLVDGAPVDFGHRLSGDERVSVYPAFRRIDVATVTKVRPAPPAGIRFVADGHLGTLARYLRLLGFDTRFDRGWADDELAEIAAGEGRVLLTRDRGLLKRTIVEHGLYLRDDDPAHQLDDVVRRLRLGAHLRPFTRCMVCNGPLEPIEKRLVADRLPPHTRATVDAFHRCRACDRLYWRGSHHPRLVELVTRARSAGASLG